MNLPKVLNYSSGFTLLEVLLAGALLVTLTGLVVPMSVVQFRTYQLSEATLNLEQILRRTQASAWAGFQDSAHGIALQSNQYVVFQGSSYATRDTSHDELISVPGISLSGPSEIVFEALTGTPAATATIMLQSDNLTQSIQLHAHGLIERQ